MRSVISYTLLLLPLLLLPVSTLAQVSLEGPLSGTLEDTLYVVEGNISVAAGDSLFIAAGARFEFTTFANFTILGRIEAVGTEEDSIYFVSDDAGTAWGSLTLQGGHEDSSRFEYAYFSGATQGAINCQGGANPILHHLDFIGNEGAYGAGVACSGSNPRISYCLFQNNTASVKAGGLYITSASPHVAHCDFIDNDGGNWGGGINIYGASSPLIEHCTISGNVAGSTGGGIHASGGTPTLRYCVIENNDAPNYGGGINLYNGAEALIEYCLITGNTVGIGGAGIYHTRSQSHIRYCTVVGNSADSYGGGICFYNSDSATVFGCIVTDNTGTGGFYNTDSRVLAGFNAVYMNDGSQFTGNWPAWINTNLIENANGDDCDLMYNIQTDPELDGDYQLTSTSPCIDAGDWRGDDDPDGTLPDMGAFYFEHDDSPDPPGSPGTVTVEATAQLQYASDHSGIQVLFVPLSPYGVRDSVLTEEAGSFSIDLPIGVYDIEYSLEGYQSVTLTQQGVHNSLNIPAQTLPLDPISGALSGTLGPGIFEVDDTLRVLEGDTLTILPGTTVYFDSAVGFVVDGVLIAEGTEEELIRFYPSANDFWQGIQMEGEAAGGSRFQWCEFTYTYPHSVAILACSPEFEDVVFYNSSAGQTMGASAFVSGECMPVFNRCHFFGNTSDYGGAAVGCQDYTTAVFQNCTFAANSSEYGSCVMILNSAPTFNSCLFTNNDGNFVIGIWTSPSAAFEHCLINDDNDAYYADELPDGLGVVNTVNTNGDSTDMFMNLYRDAAMGQITYAWAYLSPHSPAINAGDPDLALDPDGTLPDIGVHPLFHAGPGSRFDERDHEFGETNDSTAVTWRCPVLNTGYEDLVIHEWSCTDTAFSVEGEDSLVIEPGMWDSLTVWFEAEEDGDYTGLLALATNNPLLPEVTINLTGTIRTNAAGDPSQRELPEEFAIAGAYPNPFNSRLSVVVGLPEAGRLSVDVFNILGQRAARLTDASFAAGYHTFALQAHGMATGLYVVKATLGNGRQAVMKKVVLVK